MAGLIDAGRRYKHEAMGGLSDSARLEEQRRSTNEQLKSAKKATETSSMGAGAATGAMVASQMGAGAAAAQGASAGAAGGPWGMAIGALVGLVGGYLLS